MTTPDLDNVQPVNQTNNGAEDDPKDGLLPEERGDAPAPSTEARKQAKADAEGKPKDNKEQAPGDAEGSPDNRKTDQPEEPDEDTPLDTSVWGEYDDEVTTSVLQTLQNSGVTTEEAKALLWDAVEAGDPSKIDRDALVEKVGKAKATLIMAGIENITEKNNRLIQEVTNTAHEAAGGKDNWDVARKWAQKGIPEKELNELRDLIGQGGTKTKFAVSEIVSRYNADPKNTSLNAKNGFTQPDTGKTQAVKGITRREYGLELDRLYRRGGTPAEFKALSARRAAGKKQGL